MADTVITITIPDADSDRIIDHVSKRTGWTTQIEDPNNEGVMINNPTTQLQHVKNHLIAYMKRHVKCCEANESYKTQYATSNTEVDAINITAT